MNERQLIVDWLRGRGDLYPNDIFPDQQPSGPLQVVRADAWSAQVARKFCDVWAAQIEAGDHLQREQEPMSMFKETEKNYWIDRAAQLCDEYDQAEVRLATELRTALKSDNDIACLEIARVLCLAAEGRITELAAMIDA